MRKLLAIALLGAALLALPTGLAQGAYRGRLEIVHRDDFKHDRTRTTYTLVRGRHRTPLELTRAPRVPAGAQVVVRGRRVGSRIRGRVSPLGGGFLRAAGVPAGPRNTAVILINFTGDTRAPWTTDLVRQRVFTDTNSTNAFYTEESYGAVSLVGKLHSDGDVFGWYTLAPTTAGCDTNNWASLAQAAAAHDGFVAANYKHVIYAFPNQSSCGAWAGLGEIGGPQSWLNGTISVRVSAHELGHNMGLHHASSLACVSGTTPVAYSSTCTPDEYGDPFDVMGSAQRHNNAWHLRQIGFMPAANVQTASAPGTYTISSAIARGSGTQLLRVPQSGSSPQKYFDLELRSPGGVFDTFATTDPAVQGVTIHLDPAVTSITQSLLIDTTPGSPGGFADAPLAPGRTFTAGSTSVTVDSITGTTATVEVAAAPPPDTQAPSAPQPVAQPAEDHVTLQWPASTDNVGVAGYRVSRDGALMTTVTGTSWTDTVVTPGSTYSYTVTAFDAAGNAAPSAAVSATVPAAQPAAPPATTAPPSGSTPPPAATAPPPASPGAAPVPPAIPVDSTKPAVRLLAPAGRSRLRRSVVVRAAATDDTGVARIELWIDGRLRRTVGGDRIAWRWGLGRIRPGRHLVVVRAYDAAGNSGIGSARVRVLRAT